MWTKVSTWLGNYWYFIKAHNYTKTRSDFTFCSKFVDKAMTQSFNYNNKNWLNQINSFYSNFQPTSKFNESVSKIALRNCHQGGTKLRWLSLITERFTAIDSVFFEMLQVIKYSHDTSSTSHFKINLYSSQQSRTHKCNPRPIMS